MSEPYSELIEGETLMRKAPGTRHEIICYRLHSIVHSSVANISSTRLLGPRSQVKVAANTTLCPDLAMVTSATGKLWLAAEIISSDDHQADTVIKKQIYEELKLSRLWMVDPRYDNVEIYQGSQYGLVLKEILGGRELLTEKLFPEFQVSVAELFETSAASG
jgi:Uma2 family endonuclease